MIRESEVTGKQGPGGIRTIEWEIVPQGARRRGAVRRSLVGRGCVKSDVCAEWGLPQRQEHRAPCTRLRKMPQTNVMTLSPLPPPPGEEERHPRGERVGAGRGSAGSGPASFMPSLRGGGRLGSVEQPQLISPDGEDTGSLFSCKAAGRTAGRCAPRGLRIPARLLGSRSTQPLSRTGQAGLYAAGESSGRWAPFCRFMVEALGDTRGEGKRARVLETVLP